MFTGIIQTTARISKASHQAQLTQIAIPLPETFLINLTLGASVSVHGVCLTVTQIQDNLAYFDIGQETLSKTTLAQIQEGSEIHLERSLKMGDEIGGHLLSGHIIGLATITHIADLPTAQRRITLSCDHSIMKYIFAKGYIALNGVSLTINETHPDGFFTVHLIPETLKRTCFNTAKVGDRVNVEIDSQTLAIVETVERLHVNAMNFSKL